MSNLLLRGAMEGHEQSWCALYHKHHEKTVAWVVRRVRARFTNLTIREAQEPAEEAVQEAWLAIVARGITPKDSMPGLLMRIALRAFWLAEKRRVAQAALAFRYMTGRPTTGGLTTGTTAAEWLAVPASVLTDARLDAWVLRHIYKMTYREVAEELGLAHNHAAAAVIAKANAALR